MEGKRRNLRSAVVAGAIAIMGLAPAGIFASPASAAGQSALITIRPAAQTHPTGAEQTYRIAVSCQGTGGSQCGPNLTITIPLDTSITPPMTDPSWTFSATAAQAGLITSGPTIVGNELIMTLDTSTFVGGFSSTLQIHATPPNLVTPNNTSWEMLPTLSGDAISDVTAPAAAASVATATPKVSVAKATVDGGSVYEVDSPIDFRITAKCSTSSTGSLDLTEGKLVDHLPPDLTYVSSTPPGGVYDPADHSVTWTFSDSDLTSMPTGCASGATGAQTFTVSTTAPSDVPPTQPIRNLAAMHGTGPDATDPDGVKSQALASIPLQIVNEPSPVPGPGYASIRKDSLAPIAEPGISSGNQYVSTFAGNWLPAGTSPAWNINSAAASYRTTVTYGMVGRYGTDLVDPVPCLDNVSGNVYSSPSPSDPACTSPALHVQVINVTSAGYDTSVNGLGQAYDSGWRPEATLTDGSTISLTANSTPSLTGSSAFFTIPAGKVVASIRLAPDDALRNAKLQLTVWGYAAGSLANVNKGLNQLRNTSTATPEITPGSPLKPISWSASLFTIPSLPQLGISKSFGANGAGPSGSTVMTLKGSATIDTALPRDLVMTDLLPLGMTWTNPVSSASFTFARGGSATTSTITGAIEKINDYQGTGRQLIRVRFPSSAFSGPGTWTVTSIGNTFAISTPTAIGVYPNTAQIYVYDSVQGQIQDFCATPSQTTGGATTAAYENDNSADLAGDGRLFEGYCENRAQLLIQGTGATFALTKTVQGDLDPLAKGALGIGDASRGGSGTYRLKWNNVGSNTLSSPVIYDLLPHPGDTGVSQGQSSVQRGSQFSPEFTGVGQLPTGISVKYSTSENPCRDEVFSDTANPGCTDDWSTTPPSPISSVRGLRFSSTATYKVGDGFSVTIDVAVPADDTNKVAWNSAATSARDATDPSNVPLPAEPPKVGLLAGVEPTISTQTSATETNAFEQISDLVTISGTNDGPGTLSWRLRGPIAPRNLTCTGLSWAGAAVAASGTIPITGDDTLTVGPETLGSGGCYSWEYSLLSSDQNQPYSSSAAPGELNELTLAAPYPPTISTNAQLTLEPGGARELQDSVHIGGIPASAPAPSPLTWTLYGPISPGPGRSCAGLSWSGAPVFASGTVAITGNGTYSTPVETLGTEGCYSFGESLPATSDSPGALSDPGSNSETVLASSPDVITQTSSGPVHPHGTSTDSISIYGTLGGTGTLDWSLVGPVDPVDSNCTMADFSSAPTVASGSIDVVGDATYTTDEVSVSGPGCYSWAELLTSASFPSPTTLVPGGPNETFLVEPFMPSIVTRAELTDAGRIMDHITLASSGLSLSDDAPQESTLRWSLFGPRPAVNGGCSGVDWMAEPAERTGQIIATRDGNYSTPGLVLRGAGCYSFLESIAATADSSSTATEAGLEPETILVSSPPIPSPIPSDGGAGRLSFTGDSSKTASLIGFGLISAGLVLGALRRRRLERR